MDFKIEQSPVFTMLKVQMAAGEVLRAEAGAMVAMSPSIELKAKTTGKGLFGAIGALVGGESLFSSEFTANGAGELWLCQSTPGDIVQLKLNGQTILSQAGAYLAGTPGLTITAQGSFKALFSGEGLFLSKISGSGDLFLGSYGAVIEKTLAAGEEFIVDTGHIVAFEESVTYTLKKASRGIFSSLASGEGLVGRYKGPGKIWVQTRNMKALAEAINPFLPKGR